MNISDYNIKKNGCIDGSIPIEIFKTFITNDTINSFKNWLGPIYIKLFTEHISDKDLISLHFYEGIQVRNWMRKRSEFKDFTDYNFDDNWIKFVQLCLKD